MSIKMLYQYPITLVGAQALYQTFKEFQPNVKPNSFQIRNFTASPLYVSSSIGVSASSYEVMIPSNSTRLFTPVRPLEGIYLVSASSGSIILNAFRNDDPKFLEYDQDSAVSVEVEIKNDSGNPLPVSLPTTPTANLATIAGAVSGTEMQVDVVTLPATPTANLATIAGAVSGTEMQVDVVTLPATPTANLAAIAGAVSGTEMQVDVVTLPATPTANLATIASAVSGTEMQVDVVAELPEGTKFIGRTGSSCFSVGTSFSRPTDTTQYTANDCISNSTSAPSVIELDLSFHDVVAFQYLKINHIIVTSNVVPTALPLDVKVWIFSDTFSIANDNSAFDISDTITNAGGVVENCSNSTVSASNHQARSNAINKIIKLSSTTSLFVALQANNDYTPQSGETFLVRVFGEIL
jgi:hypothetical protein